MFLSSNHLLFDQGINLDWAKSQDGQIHTCCKSFHPIDFQEDIDLLTVDAIPSQWQCYFSLKDFLRVKELEQLHSPQVTNFPLDSDLSLNSIPISNHFFSSFFSKYSLQPFSNILIIMNP